MEFLDEDARPRFLLQSKSTPQQSSSSSSSSYLSSLHKPTLLISLSLSILLLTLSFFTFNFEPLQSLLIWLSLSLLLGPFAPPSLTAGHIRVGLGPPIKPIPVLEDEPDSIRRFGRRSRSGAKIDSLGVETGFEGKRENGYLLDLKKNDGVGRKEVKKSRSGVKIDSLGVESVFEGKRGNGYLMDLKKSEGVGRTEKFGKSSRSGVRIESLGGESDFGVEEGRWSDGDVEMLKKFMGKHPVGKPGRWEAITEGFGGRYKVESVIKKSKELGEKKVGDEDSFKKFLKDRKPVDTPIENENGDEANGESKGESGGVWSAGEDLALLNALKTFPKEVAMRWEKIAVAVPGKSKAACVKRVAVLKKDFRSSKGIAGEP